MCYGPLTMQVGVVIECIGASVNVLWALDNAGRGGYRVH